MRGSIPCNAYGASGTGSLVYWLGRPVLNRGKTDRNRRELLGSFAPLVSALAC